MKSNSFVNAWLRIVVGILLQKNTVHSTNKNDVISFENRAPRALLFSNAIKIQLKDKSLENQNISEKLFSKK